MRLYLETHSTENFEHSRYIFDFGTQHMISISNHGRGSTNKEMFIKHELEYNIVRYSDYRLQEISIHYFPLEYHIELLEIIFSSYREYCFMREDDQVIPEVYEGEIIR